MMNWNTIQSQWNEAKGEIRSVWNRLSEGDLSQVQGHKDRLLAVIQQRYGINLSAAEEQLQNFLGGDDNRLARLKAAAPQAAEQVRENLQAGLEKGKKLIEKSQDYMQNNTTSQIVNDVKSLIVRHPIPGALLGIGLGFLLSRALTPSSRS